MNFPLKAPVFLKKNLLILYSLAGIGMLGHGLLRPIIPIFARRVGASGFEVGLLSSGFMIARAVTSFVVGKSSDRSGRSDIFVKFGFFVLFIIAFGFFFVKHYEGILLLRFCQGICSGLIWPIIQILVVEDTEKKYRTRSLSMYQITGRSGALLSRVLLGIILFLAARFGYSELGSFRVVFLVAALILLIVFLEVMLMPKHRRVKTKKKEGKTIYPIFILGFVFGAMLALAPISFVYFNEYFKITPFGIAMLLLGLDIITMIAMYIFSHFTDHFGSNRSLRFIVILCFISTLCLPFIPSLTIFVVCYFLMRISISSFIPISRSYATSFDAEIGTNIGTLNMMTNLGSVVGPIFAGFIYDHFPGTYKIAGYSIIAIFLVPAAFMLLHSKSNH